MQPLAAPTYRPAARHEDVHVGHDEHILPAQGHPDNLDRLALP